MRRSRCRRRPSRAALLVAVLGCQPAFACLWDFDTLFMERRRFPTVLELITGKFLRRSPELYEWRIEDRRRRLETDPDDLALYDDLAVAYDKIGKHHEAIATMLAKEAKHPGHYETYANLGTFHVHAGELERGLPYIEKAIEINPNAHFGREVIQRHLVEYVLTKRSNGTLPLPLRGPTPPLSRLERDEEPEPGFKNYLAQITEGPVSDEEALKGVLGMMRFGHFDSPVLLETLAELLPRGRLKARAYLKASYEVESEEVRQAYRAWAEDSLLFPSQTRLPVGTESLTIDDVEASFRSELAEAEAWYEGVRERELQWIREGANPDAQFVEVYGEEPSVSYGHFDLFLTVMTLGGHLEGYALVLVWIGGPLIVGVLVWRARRQRASRAGGESSETPADTRDDTDGHREHP